MFARLAFLVVCLGLIGASLLALRQARLQAASEAAQAQLRIASADEELFSLRAQVAATVTPSAVEKLASSMHPIHPATNEIPKHLAIDHLKGLPAASDDTPTPRVESKANARKPVPNPSKKPPSPRVARGN